MPTLNHPRIPNVTVDVPDSDVDSWEASGWVNLAPTPAPVFDEGGTLEPGLNEVRNDTGEDEPLVRPKRSRKK